MIFQAFKPLQPLQPDSTALSHQRTFWFWWFDDYWHQNDQYWSIFVEWIINNPILAPFLLEAVEDSQCYFFENWFMKLKFSNLLKLLGTIIQHNYGSFYHSELIYFALFTMRHPLKSFKLRFESKSLNLISLNLIRIICQNLQSENQCERYAQAFKIKD